MQHQGQAQTEEATDLIKAAEPLGPVPPEWPDMEAILKEIRAILDK